MIPQFAYRKRTILRSLWLAGLIGLAVMSISRSGEAQTLFLQTSDAEETYLHYCSSCHGPDGEGGVGPSLQRSTADLDTQLSIIRFGSSVMPGFAADLTEEELQAVTEYSASLGVVGDVTVELGSEVFLAHCATCHGVGAEGGAGPNLTRSDLPRTELTAIVSDGRGTMPAFAAELSPTQLAAAVTFVEAQRVVGVTPRGGSEPSIIADGARVFSNTCAECHGPDAAGGAGPALRASLLTDAELVSVISNGRGAMPGFSGLLDAEAVHAVVAYVDAARAAFGTQAGAPQDAVLGRQVYVVTCATCHGLTGAGGLGPSLAGIDLTANEIISRVFGGHPEGMPAYEGVLDALQVKEVAQYILTIEGEPSSGVAWVVYAVAVGAAIALGLSLWYWGVLDGLLARVRRTPTDPGQPEAQQPAAID